MASNEEELQKLAYEAQYLEQQMQEFQRQFQQAAVIQGQLEQTIQGIGGLEKANGDPYFQLGSGAFMKATPTPNLGVLVEIGSGVFIEKAPSEAISILGKRKDSIEKALGVLKGNIEKISKRLSEIDLKAADLQK